MFSSVQSRIFKNRPAWQYAAASLAVIVIFALTLLGMGRVPWCTCGYVKFWHGVVFSSENSQHIADFYTFSHVIHGFAFFGILWLFARRLPVGVRAVGAVIAEVAWEIFENTDLIINRYREATISLDYYGDSVINSVSDVAAMVVGFWIAARLPVWATIALAILMEIVVGMLIRDNLTLNIIMLIFPLQAIKNWQAAG